MFDSALFKRMVVLAVFLCGAFVICSTAAGRLRAEECKPMAIIFDTDIGNDIDDALALALIHVLQNRGECRLLAVTVTNDSLNAARFVDLVNTFYGRGDIPIGLVREGVRNNSDNRFTAPLVRKRDGERLRYPRSFPDDYVFPDATALLRKTLAAAEDHSLVIVQTGFSTNLARLLLSKPDAYSSLDGKSLIAQKTRLLSFMGGAFTEKRISERYLEYNIKKDKASAQTLFRDWPGPIIVSGLEIGGAICYPAASILEDYGYVPHHPIAEAYEHYLQMPYDRPTWDLTSVLAAVRPDRGYFGLSPNGTITVADDGFASFKLDPKGQCRYLTVNTQQIVRVRETFVNLCSEPPK